MSGKGLSEQKLFDLGINFLRVPARDRAGRGHSLPVRRQVPADSDRSRSRGDAGARALGQDVANALAAQNLITPVGTEKIGTFEYAINLNNAPSVIKALGDLPIKSVNGAMVYIHDVAHVRDGNPPQTTSCTSTATARC